MSTKPAAVPALRAGSLLAALSPEDQEHLRAQSVPRRHARGTVILRRGDPGTSMIMVTEGQVRVGVTSEDGREVTLAILGPGDVLGEMALLDGEARSADVVALEACAVQVLERARFLRALSERPAVALRLLSVLAARLRRANRAVEDIALLSLEARLARLLTRLAQDYGSPAGGRGVRIGIKLSQKDIANLVGSSREKVNRQLRAWEEDGTLGKTAGHLVLLRPERLTSEVD